MQKIGTAFYRHMQLLATIGALLKIALVFARGVFALFVAAVLGFGLYVMSLPVALSIWGYGDSLVMLLVLATGIGAGIGSYITWFDRNFNLGVQALLLVMALTCAVSGAWLGYGVGVGLDHPIWKPRHTRDEYHDDGRSYRRKCAAASTWFVQRNQGPALVICSDKFPQMRKRDAPLDSRRVPFCLCSVFY